MKTIGIIDPHPVFCAGFEAACLGMKSVRVVAGSRPEEMACQAGAGTIDLLVIGISSGLPDVFEDFIEPGIRMFPGLPVTVCFDCIDERVVLKCLRAGVKGYILKEAPIEELHECLALVLEGKRYMGLLLEQVLYSLFIRKVEFGPEAPEKLSRREAELAQYLTKGLRTSVIARLMQVKSPTISTMKRKVFRKLQVKNTVEMIKVIKSYKN